MFGRELYLTTGVTLLLLGPRWKFLSKIQMFKQIWGNSHQTSPPAHQNATVDIDVLVMQCK